MKNDIGPYLQERWRKLGDHPLVGETRMVGLMGALELVASTDTLERFPEERGAGTVCRDIFVENGLVLRAVGDTMVCAPPLVLTHEEADELVDKAWQCLDMTAKERVHFPDMEPLNAWNLQIPKPRQEENCTNRAFWCLT